MDVVESDWGQGANLDVLASKLASDRYHSIKAICIVHNETATGVTNNLATVRKLLGMCKIPEYYLSSTSSVPYRPGLEPVTSIVRVSSCLSRVFCLIYL